MKKENEQVNQDNGDAKTQGITFCKEDRDICYYCVDCLGTFMLLPDGTETFYHCGCN